MGRQLDDSVERGAVSSIEDSPDWPRLKRLVERGAVIGEWHPETRRRLKLIGKPPQCGVLDLVAVAGHPMACKLGMGDGAIEVALREVPCGLPSE